jgi:hypothetical protein
MLYLVKIYIYIIKRVRKRSRKEKIYKKFTYFNFI